MRIKKTLDTVIYDQIVNGLIMGEYKMGELISLEALANRFEVSRTPVGQAVKLLANDGILEILTNGRVMVPTYTEPQISKICELRLLLEMYALERIFQSKDDAEHIRLCTELSEIAETASAYNEKGDKLGFSKNDLKFHKSLVAGSKNEFLIDIYNRVQGRFVVANYLYVPWDQRGFNAAAHAHLEFVKAIRAWDEAVCKRILEEHILSTKLANPPFGNDK